MSSQHEECQIPEVDVGDIVFWWDGDSQSVAPSIAIVTQIGWGGHTLNLNIIDPKNYNMRIRDGVRHVNDTRARPDELRASGTWDHTTKTYRLLELQEQVKRLVRELEIGENSPSAREESVR